MLTFACVLRKSNDYDEDYVNRLCLGVAEYLPKPYRFVCLSDVPVPCEHIPFAHDWPGWWSKIELFKLPPPVLYADLDTMVVGSLKEIAGQARKAPLTILRDFYREKGLGSGFMAWNVSMLDLYDRFASSPEKFMQRYGKRGDQAFMEEHVRTVAKWQDALPGQVVSYKADVRGQDLPKDARVVCFHGKPKPRDIAWTL